MQPVEQIPGVVDNVEDLVQALNERIDTINADLQSLSSSSNSQVPPQPSESGYQGSQEGNAFTYSNPDTNVYDFLDPLFQAIRTAQVLVSQAGVQANAIGNLQMQADSITARNITAGSIVAGSIAANAVTTVTIAAGAVTATKISVSQLDAISANLGTITAGNITLDNSGFIRGGQTAYNTGSGFWMGYSSGYKFSIGNGSTNAVTWDGSTLAITGSLTATTGTIGGWTIGATTITGGSVTLDSAGNVRAGQTAYNTGTGFWLGTVAGTPKFSLGVSTTNYLTWDGTNLLVQGGATPNFVFIDTTTFNVGISGARRTSLGTFGGNAASLNFYNASNVSLMGLFLNGNTAPNISLQSGNTNYTLSADCANADSTITLTGPSSAMFRATCAAGPMQVTMNGTSALGLYPQISIIDQTTGSTSVLAADYLRVGGNGSVTVPAYSFASNTNDGMFLNAAGDIRFACGGVQAFIIRLSGTPKIVCGATFQNGSPYVAGVVAPTGSMTMYDSGGTLRTVPCL